MKRFNLNVKANYNKILKGIILLFLLCFISHTNLLSQTTYYVDAVNGSNTNTGTSPDKAWQTVGHVNSISFSPGDSILFKCGNYWTYGLDIRSSGTAGNPIVYGSYGTGSKPKLNVADYIDFGISIINRHYITIDNIEVTGKCHYGICIDAADYVTIKNCYIHDISPHNEWHGIVLMHKPSHPKILNNEIAYVGAEGIFGESDNIEIAYNNIHDINQVGTVGCCIQLNIYASNFHVHHNILDHSNNTGPKGVISCSHGCLGDVDIRSNGIFEYNTCTGGPGDDFAYGSLAQGETVRYNTFTSKYKRKESNAIKLSGVAHHNIIKGYDRAFFNRSESNEIYYNIIDSCGRGLDANTDLAYDIKFKNNILNNISSAYYVVGPNMNFESSNNLYSPGAGWTLKGVGYNSLAALQGMGYDINSIYDRPLFLNPERSNYKPDENSPSIDKGTNLGIDIDLDGKGVVDYPDIGAYEFTGGDTTVVHNNPPSINNQSYTVYDNTTNGTNVANIIAYDIDIGQDLSYEIISGNTGNAFVLSESTGTLSVNSNDGLINNDIFSLLVRVTDDGTSPLADSAYLTVNINHVNPEVSNNPPIINAQEFDISEEDDLSSIVMGLTAYDPDEGQHLAYSILSGNNENIFSLGTSTGELTVSNASKLDFENISEIDLNIQVQDDGEGYLTGTAIITINLIPVITAYYIDPGNTNDPLEDGSKGHPYNSWADVTWEEGKSYLQKRGTTANESKINVYASNVTLGAYGEGERPVINSVVTDFAIRAFEKSGVTIQNLSIVAEEAISCIYFLGTTCDNNLIENCHLEGADNGLRIIDGKTITLRYNTFSNNSDAIYSYAETTKIYYNVFKENDTGINISSYLSSTEIYNNVFYDNTRGVSTSYSSLTIYNNIFYLQDKGDQAINHKMDNLVSDNNIFYPEQDGFLDIGDKKYSSLYDYQQSMGLDLNSFTSDPLFKDVYDDNFSVDPTSPAIDGGRTVGLLMDFYGYSVPSGRQPDIGLIESLDDNIVSSIDPFGSAEDTESPLIFPNPSDGRFKISFSNTDFYTLELQIKDMAGNLIYRDYREAGNIDPVALVDISHVSKGIYLVLLTIDDKVYTQRVVVN